jgi:predicted nucleic acid-binding protein
MPRFTALFDANVLFPARVRDLLIELATTGVFRARWSEAIHDEWMSSLLASRPDLTRERLARTRALMDQAVPDAIVSGYEHLIEGLQLPDPDDRHVLAAAIVGRADLIRHVLAAAIVGRADVIVTTNIKDFPAATLEVFDLEAQHPDTFLIHQRSLDEHLFLEAIRRVRRRLTNPQVDPDAYLTNLGDAGLVLIAAELANTKTLL